MPKLGHDKGTTFADIWQQKPKAASQLKGLKARGCYGFGYESNLEEFIKYGHSLDDLDSKKASWENAINIAAAQHKQRMKSGGFNADSDDDNDDMNSSSRLKSKAFEEAFDDITDSDDDEADGAVAEAVPADQVDVATRLGGTATSVHYAAQYNELETVQMLLDRGADLNAVNEKGRTALHIACTRGYLRMVIALLAAPSWIEHLKIKRSPLNLDLRDVNGHTALHLAAKEGSHHICEKLIAAGADASVRDAQGNAPAIYAQKQATYHILQDAVVKRITKRSSTNNRQLSSITNRQTQHAHA